jgi:hypothetical protein
MTESWAEGDTLVCAMMTLRVVLFLYNGTSECRFPRRRRSPRSSIEIEIEIVYNMYRMRRFTAITVCAGCCLWALPTMPFMKLTSHD